MEIDMKKAALIAGVLTAIIIVALVLTAEWRIHSTGQIKAINVGVYSDELCTQELSAIDWGLLAPSEMRIAGIYIKNTGNSPQNITIYTNNYQPVESEIYLQLTWNYDEHELAVNEVILVTLTLTVSQSIIGINEFTFDIVIKASG